MYEGIDTTIAWSSVRKRITCRVRSHLMVMAMSPRLEEISQSSFTSCRNRIKSITFAEPLHGYATLCCELPCFIRWRSCLLFPWFVVCESRVPRSAFTAQTPDTSIRLAFFARTQQLRSSVQSLLKTVFCTRSASSTPSMAYIGMLALAVLEYPSRAVAKEDALYCGTRHHHMPTSAVCKETLHSTIAVARGRGALCETEPVLALHLGR
jgi:hypothetical protein